MTIRFRVLESFDGSPPQNDTAIPMIPYAEYEKQQAQIEALTAELEATRELAFQDGYKSASSEARNLVEKYYQKLADNIAHKVKGMEGQLEQSAQSVAATYGKIVYAVAAHLLPRYITAHATEEFVDKMSEILKHEDDRVIQIAANGPMIARLQAMASLKNTRIHWRVDSNIHDGEIEAYWDRGGYQTSVEQIISRVDEILTSCLNIESVKRQEQVFLLENQAAALEVH